MINRHVNHPRKGMLMTDENVTPEVASEAAAEREIDENLSEAERTLSAQVATLTAALAAAEQSKADLLARTMQVARKYAKQREWCSVADQALAEIDPSLRMPRTVHDVNVTLRFRFLNSETVGGMGRNVPLTREGAVTIYHVRDYVHAAMRELSDEDSMQYLLDAEITDTVYNTNNDDDPTGLPIGQFRRYRLGEDGGEMDMTVIIASPHAA